MRKLLSLDASCPPRTPEVVQESVLVFVTLQPQERIALESQAYLDGLTL